MYTIDELVNDNFQGNENVKVTLKNLLNENIAGYNVSEEYVVAIVDVFIAAHNRYKDWRNINFIDCIWWYIGKYFYEKVWEGKHETLLSVFNRVFIYGFMAELKHLTVEEFILKGLLKEFIDQYFCNYCDLEDTSVEEIDLEKHLKNISSDTTGDSYDYDRAIFYLFTMPEIIKGLGMGELTYLRQLKEAPLTF